MPAEILLSGGAGLRAFCDGRGDLFNNMWQRMIKPPFGEMGSDFSQVAVIADVIADAVGFLVGELGPLAGDFEDQLDAFHEAGGVLFAAAEVVDFSRAWVLCEFPEEADDVMAVDLIADLLAFVSKDGVGAFAQGDEDEVIEEAMELDA